MKLLVENGAEVDAKSPYFKYTALHLAAFEGSMDTVRFLVQHNADTNAKGFADATPIFFAASGGNYEAVELFLSRGASGTERTKGGTPLLRVAAAGRWPVMRATGSEYSWHTGYLRSREDKVINVSSWPEGDHGKVVRLLVGKGAEVDRFSGGVTALQEACFAGNAKAVEALLELGADLSLKTGDPDSHLWARPHYNALDAAVWGGVKCDPEQGGRLVEALVRAGAKVNRHDATGKTPLHHAAANLHVDAIKVLLKAGADISGVDRQSVPEVRTPVVSPPWYRHSIDMDHGQTPLFTALKTTFFRDWREETQLSMRAKHLEVIKLLLDNGADIAAKLPDGATPLHIAALFGYGKGIIELLIARGADVNATDNELATPLHYAMVGRSYQNSSEMLVKLDLVQVLARNGASGAARTRGKGMTPLDWAKYSWGSDDNLPGAVRLFSEVIEHPELGTKRFFESGPSTKPAESRPATQR